MMKNRKYLLFYILFFTLLLGVFYWALSDERPFQESKLAVINAQIPPFSFTDQNNKIITNRETEGKVYVAEYFFTSCKGICPKMNTNMRRVYDQFKNEPEFLILSHTCMPETDSVYLMKAYEQRMLKGELKKQEDGSYKMLTSSSTDTTTINDNHIWHFLTGDKSMLYNLARHGYMIDNGKSDTTQLISDQFIHTQFFALVDKYGRVRGIYDGLVEKEIEKLLTDIPDLLKEKIDHTRFLNGFSNTPN